MSETPRTDEATDFTAPERLHQLCKELERDVTRLKAEIERLRDSAEASAYMASSSGLSHKTAPRYHELREENERLKAILKDHPTHEDMDAAVFLANMLAGEKAALKGENETLREVNLLLHKALAPYLNHPDRERVEMMQKAINLALPILDLCGTQYPYEACEQAGDILKETLRKGE